MTWVQTTLDAISLGSLYAIYALGIAILFGIMNLINFAQGEFIMASQFALLVFIDMGLSIPLVIFLALTVCIVIALMTERVAFRPIRGASPATLLITSFAVSFLLQNIATLIFGAVPRTFTFGTELTTSFTLGSIQIVKLSLVTILLVAAVLLGLGAFLRRTRMGAEMRAAAEDFEMARLLGIRANRVIGVAFAIAATLATAAGVVLAIQTGFVSPTNGLTPVLIAFIATILGGVGSLVGPAVAGFLLGVGTVVLQVWLPTDILPYRDALLFSGVFVLIVLRPQGLIVSRSHMVRV